MSLVQSESMVNLLNEGSASFDQPGSSEGKSATTSTVSQLSGSQEPLVEPDQESKDSPLPTLETADGPRKEGKAEKSGRQEEEDEDGGGYASVKKPSGRYDYVDKMAGGRKQNTEDEAGYAYATVGGAMGKGPAAAPSGNGGGAGEGGGDDKEKGSGLPPYGKVTRHMVPVAKKSGYSEVLTSSPMLPRGRTRAVTEPLDPAQADSNEREGKGLRDERAFTESAAHLPLPQIPKLDISDGTYDSIPDGVRESADGAGKRSSSGAAAKRNGSPVRESLYESVEVDEAGVAEADEDMYESVPEDVRPKAASMNSPSSPVPPPPRSPGLNRTKTEGTSSLTPPASPLTKEGPDDEGKNKGKDHVGKESKNEQKKHKALSKAKSDASTDQRGRSLSSLFTRKKPAHATASNSPLSPKGKKQHKPLPKVPTTGAVPSPTHLLPPSPPPMPAPPPPPDEEQEEDDYPADSAYDMVEVINPRGAALLKDSNAAKAKSASLPSSMRTAGPSMLHHGHGPLPDLPEESAGGLVARQRVPEDMDPEYDTVVLGQVQNDPSYDSVKVAQDGSNAMPKLEPAEPTGTQPPPAGGEGEEGATPANKYARVSSHAAVDSTFSPPDLTAFAPEHDELGYAVIPAHLKMRKKALSDAAMRKAEERKKSRPKNVEMVEDVPVSSDTPAPAAGGGNDAQHAPTPPMEPEYESVTDAMRNVSDAGPPSAGKKETPYASVNMAAKRRSQLLKQQSGSAGDDESIAREPSPNPPPLPQQGYLGDLSEFQRPPVPLQAQSSLEIVDPVDLKPLASSVSNPYSQIDVLTNDPPYASVKKKEQEQQAVKENKASEPGDEDENPYSTVLDNSDGIVALPGQNDPPYAKVQKGKVVEGGEERDQDPGPGYAKAGSKRLADDGSFESGNATNGTHRNEEEDDDTYDRLDHGLGGSGSYRATALTTSPAPDGEGEYSTVTVDFSTSPELVVTHADSVRREENGVVRQVEETTISFAE